LASFRKFPRRIPNAPAAVPQIGFVPSTSLPTLTVPIREAGESQAAKRPAPSRDPDPPSPPGPRNWLRSVNFIAQHLPAPEPPARATLAR